MVNKFFNWKSTYFLVAIFFLFSQLIVSLANVYAGRFNVFFWFCNHVPLVFAFAFFFKKINIIKALINVGFFAQFIWTLDFFFRLITKNYLIGVTRYVFDGTSGILVFIPILIHLSGASLAFFITRKKKPTYKALKYSFIYLIILYIITLKFSDPVRNINCVYEICGFTDYNIKFYTPLWPVITFLMIVLPTQGIQWIVYKFYAMKKRS